MTGPAGREPAAAVTHTAGGNGPAGGEPAAAVTHTAGGNGPAGGASRGFAADARRHRRDAPRHCPRCGASLGTAGITVEFWQGRDRIFHTWCAGCHWTGDIIPVTDMIGHEPEH